MSFKEAAKRLQTNRKSCILVEVVTDEAIADRLDIAIINIHAQVDDGITFPLPMGTPFEKFRHVGRLVHASRNQWTSRIRHADAGFLGANSGSIDHAANGAALSQ